MDSVKDFAGPIVELTMPVLIDVLHTAPQDVTGMTEDRPGSLSNPVHCQACLEVKGKCHVAGAKRFHHSVREPFCQGCWHGDWTIRPGWAFDRPSLS